ncbi:MAG: FAD-dependent oxidoreductase [Planctomycetota bacterium]
MSVSYWSRSLASDVLARVDVCVVGAGVAGLAAADAAAELGRTAAIVERGTAGVGASSRNAGYLMRGAADSYAAAVDQLGRDAARELWQRTEDNLRLLCDRFGAHDLPSFRRVPSVLVATSEAEAALLTRSAALLNEDGFDARLVTSGSDSLWATLRPAVALENPNDASINPAELIARMASHVRVRTPIFEGAEVFGFEPGGESSADPGGERRVRVMTRRGVVDAQRVVVCTNAWGGDLLPGLAGRVTPNRGQMLAIDAPGVSLDASYYLNCGGEYIRMAHDGRVVVGGLRKRFEAEERTTSAEPTEPMQAALEELAERTLGVRGRVVARWAGTMGFTHSGLPIVESVPVEGLESGWVWFCGGFTGHGMSLGVATASEAVRRMLG